MESSKESVGLVGFGLLGAAFAERLISSGFTVCAHDVAPERVAEMALAGVEQMTIEQLAKACRRIILVVYSSDQAARVVSEIVALRNAPRTSLPTILCSTTLDPDTVAEIAAAASDPGFDFIEFPVSGTSMQVRNGEGLGLVGADHRTMAAHIDVIQSLTPRNIHIGAVGQAANAKLAINLVLEINRSALAEGLVLAEKLGLDLELFQSALRESAAYSKVMDGKIPKMLSDEFSPEGRSTQSLKDVRMMLAQAHRVGQCLPLTQVQADLLSGCVTAGQGNLDGSVVIQEIRRRRA